MGRVFLNKKFSNYLGENRAILDIVARFVPDGPIPSPSPTPTLTRTPTPTPSITPSITPSVSPTPTITPTSTQGLTPSPTPTPSITPSITPTITTTPTITITPSITPTITTSPTTTPTPTLTPTPTSTPPVVLEFHLRAENSDNIMTESSDYIDIDITPEYEAILNNALLSGFTLPDVVVQGNQNALVSTLVDSGIWSKLDGLFVFRNGDSGGSSLEDFTLQNWIEPTQGIFSPNAPAYLNGASMLDMSGMTAPSSNSFFSTFNNDTNYSSYTQNDAIFFTTLTSAPTTANPHSCGYNTGRGNLQIDSSSKPSINSTTSGSFDMSFTTPHCFRALSRNNSTQATYWKENVGTTVSSISTGILSGNFVVGNRSSSPATGTNYDGYISTFGVGGSLTQSEINILVSALNTYNNTIN